MNIRDHILAAIGVGAFILCVLACRPAFSPDGKKVVFPVFDPGSEQTTVMLYDRERDVWKLSSHAPLRRTMSLPRRCGRQTANMSLSRRLKEKSGTNPKGLLWSQCFLWIGKAQLVSCTFPNTRT